MEIIAVSKVQFRVQYYRKNRNLDFVCLFVCLPSLVANISSNVYSLILLLIQMVIALRSLEL